MSNKFWPKKSIFTTRSFLILFEILFRISATPTLDVFFTVVGERKDIVVLLASCFKTPHHRVVSLLGDRQGQFTVEVAPDVSSSKAAHVRISYKPENNTKYSWLNVCAHATYQFYYRPSHIHMCESYVTSNPGSLSLSLFASLVVEKTTLVAAGHVAPKIWEHPYPQKCS